MIKLFDDKFVHFRWTDELKDKMCFVADDIGNLELKVNGLPYCTTEVEDSRDKDFPIQSCNTDTDYRFCYYDPHYDIKVAFNKGKTIECQGLAEDGSFCWFAVKDEEELLGFIAQDRYLRIKSDTEEVKPVIPTTLDPEQEYCNFLRKFKEIMDSLNNHNDRIEKLEESVNFLKQWLESLK